MKMIKNFSVDTKVEIDKIVSFLANTLYKSKKKKVIVSLSGGIDSSVSLALSIKAVGVENVLASSFPYGDLSVNSLTLTSKLVSFMSLPPKNVEIIDITKSVDSCIQALGILEDDIVRRGNVMARMRMVYLFDIAKKHDALVVGTENRSEHLLGYFTRFGDESSDIEPIRHLYKTHIYTFARELSLPEEIIVQPPTAGLWSGQSDEGQLGFTYKEADKVLSMHFDEHIPFEHISRKDFPNRDRIKEVVEANQFKHHVPYTYASSFDE